MKNYYFKCAGSCHILEIEHDEEFGTYISIWHSNPKGMGFFERLRWACRILCTGSPWADEFIVQEKDRNAIAQAILAEKS